VFFVSVIFFVFSVARVHENLHNRSLQEYRKYNYIVMYLFVSFTTVCHFLLDNVHAICQTNFIAKHPCWQHKRSEYGVYKIGMYHPSSLLFS